MSAVIGKFAGKSFKDRRYDLATPHAFENVESWAGADDRLCRAKRTSDVKVEFFQIRHEQRNETRRVRWLDGLLRNGCFERTAALNSPFGKLVRTGGEPLGVAATV